MTIKKSFADTTKGKIVIGVSITVIAALLLWWSATFGGGIVQGSKDGTEALKQNNEKHPKIDSIEVKLTHRINVFFEKCDRRAYKDSVQQAEFLYNVDLRWKREHQR